MHNAKLSSLRVLREDGDCNSDNVFFSSSLELEFERDSRKLQLPELESELGSGLGPDEDKETALMVVVVLSCGAMEESWKWDLRGVDK